MDNEDCSDYEQSDCENYETNYETEIQQEIDIYKPIDDAYQIYSWILNYINYNGLPLCQDLKHLDIVNLLEN